MPEGRPRPRPVARAADKKAKAVPLLPSAPKGTLLQTLTDALAGDALTPRLLQSLSQHLAQSPPDDAAHQLLDAAVDGSSTVGILCTYLLQRCPDGCVQNVRNFCHQMVEQHASPTVPLRYKEVGMHFAVALVAVGRMTPLAVTNLAQALVAEVTQAEASLQDGGEPLTKVRCLVQALTLVLDRQPSCDAVVQPIVDRLAALPPAGMPKELLRLRCRLSPVHCTVAAAVAAALVGAAVHVGWGGGLSPAEAELQELSPGRCPPLARPADVGSDYLSESSQDVGPFLDPTEASTQDLEQQTLDLQSENEQLLQEVASAKEAAEAWLQDRTVLEDEVRQLRQVIRQLSRQNAHLSQCIVDISHAPEVPKPSPTAAPLRASPPTAPSAAMPFGSWPPQINTRHFQ